MANRKAILVLDLGSSSGRALVFSLPQYEVIGSARFDVRKCDENFRVYEFESKLVFTFINALSGYAY